MKIEKSCQKKVTDLAMRKMIMIGTNQYPNLEEKMIGHVVDKRGFTFSDKGDKIQTA